MEANDIVFWVCFGISIPAAMLVVTRKNPVYGAVSLLVAFLAFAVIFLTAHATFLAAIHVIVCTGAILVLFLFVIMLLNLRKEEMGEEHPIVIRALIGLICAGFSVGLIVLFWKAGIGFETAETPPGFGEVKQVGKALFSGPYLFHLELIALLLLVAMIGAMILAKKKM